MDKIDSESKSRVPGLAERMTRLALAGSFLLTACGRSFDSMMDSVVATDTVRLMEGSSINFSENLVNSSESEGVVDKVEGSYIAYDKEIGGDQGLWQVTVSEGGSVLGAIKSISELEGNIGYAATIISPDKSRVIQFSGSPGGGKNALEVTAGLSEDGAFASESILADVDMRTIPKDTEVVVGTTDIINQNFESLLAPGGALADVNEYWRVEWRSAKDPQGNLMQWYTVTRYSRESEGDHWIRTPYIQFNRDATLLGPWTPVGE